MDKHDLICQLKDLALELQRTPTRDEYCNRVKNGRRAVDLAFGSYTTMLHAAGLNPVKSKKINNSIFEVKDIESYLSQHEKKITSEKKEYPSIATISDIHWPFVYQRVVDRFYEYVGDLRPSYVILNGDAWDMYSHGKFPRSHNVFTPRDEQAMARKMNEDFWLEIKRRHPKAECVQMMGNHDIRPLKRIIEEYPEAEDWVKEKIQSLFTYPGVKTIHDPREELMLSGNISVFHGYRTKLGDSMNYTLFNCINGHSHRGGCVFRQIRGEVLWELNSGYAGDPTAKGLTYTAQKISDWTHGFGIVNKYGPQFVSV